MQSRDITQNAVAASKHGVYYSWPALMARVDDHFGVSTSNNDPPTSEVLAPQEITLAGSKETPILLHKDL